MYAIGYSLGANLLVKYLGEEGRNGFRPLAGAVSVSNPWNFEDNTMASGRAKGLVAAVMGKVYSWALATGVKVTPFFRCYFSLLTQRSHLYSHIRLSGMHLH